MNRMRVNKDGKLGLLWCKYCGREIEEKEIKPGTFKCEVCGRLLTFKELIYPEGTIPVIDERHEPVIKESPVPVRLFEPGQVKAMLHEMNLEACPPGCILIEDEKPESGQTVSAHPSGALTLPDLVRAMKEIEMRDKGIIVVDDESQEP